MQTKKNVNDIQGFLANGPLITVIIPVYNTESSLSRCIESILNQTYRNFEIILVNDGSTDGSLALAQEYAKQYPNINIVQHEKNEGLLRSRISGVNKAKGDYIAFVDSDDYVSIDWFRSLMQKAYETDSDIVIGEFFLDDGKDIFYWNLDPFRLKDYDLYGEDVLHAFMDQEGRFFGWWSMWNKLYRKDLWQQCLPDYDNFQKEHGNITVKEDIVLSSSLWCHAAHVSNVHGSYYFSVDHGSADLTDFQEAQKYISDSSAAMQFMKSMLEKKGAFENHDIKCHFDAWNSKTACGLYQEFSTNADSALLYETTIRTAFSYEASFETNETNEEKNFFYSLKTPLRKNSLDLMESIKKTIVSPDTKYVSFDIFDTLIQRPFSEPSDLFYFISDEFNRDTASYVDFVAMRISAERSCRRKKPLRVPFCEEVTIDEIYEELRETTMIPADKLERLKQREQELELQFCAAKSSGLDLYYLALQAEKKVIIISDIYLYRDLIEAMLKKAGFKNYYRLFLSSEVLLTKGSGNLYRHAQKALGSENPSEFVHLGDNVNSDITNSKKCGWNAFHVRRAMELLKNTAPIGYYTGDSYQAVWRKNGQWSEYRNTIWRYPSLRNIIGVVANRVFSTPFVSINRDSDFNADPRFIGYAVLGPYLLAINTWIIKLAKERKIPTVHFVARDGYMVKQAFDLLNDSDTASNYLLCSRKSTLLIDTKSCEDLYSLPKKCNVLVLSPKKSLEYLNPLLSKNPEQMQEIFRQNGIHEDKYFKDYEEFYAFIKFLNDNGLFDFSKLTQYQSDLRNYFSQMFRPGDYLFDVGYHGRQETSISCLLGYPVNSLYLHTDSELASKRQKQYNCVCECFMGNRHYATGLMREHLLMELAPSTIGYKIDNGKVQPVFESNYEQEYCSKFSTELVQQYALEFIRDYCSIFGEFRNDLDLPIEALAAPFEYYLHSPKKFDQQIFSTLYFEDSISRLEKVSVLDFWQKQINDFGSQTNGKAKIYDEDKVLQEFTPSTGVKGALKTFIGKHLPGKNNLPAQNFGLAPSIALWLLKKTFDEDIRIGFSK